MALGLGEANTFSTVVDLEMQQFYRCAHNFTSTDPFILIMCIPVMFSVGAA